MHISNGMPIDEIDVGMSVSYSQTITDADVKQFAGISGDHNPVHVDEVYASESRFKRRIAHGLLSGSFFSGMFGTRLPGHGCVYVSQSFNFKRPVYLGDTVTAIATVKSIDVSTRRVIFDTVCKVRGKTVIDGVAEIYIP
ncbi:MaoC family dehydratase [Vibrio neptunius]|uniref:MaoC family dehydratase n=1 Tax=Vibrio neptunius TaxID=170651 RepID=UPI001C5C8368|nr:MaoC family dehydratase [Vibrio neptunius]QXX06772.1 MaoC family dehydratase [Vibrio neptunius]